MVQHTYSVVVHFNIFEEILCIRRGIENGGERLTTLQIVNYVGNDEIFGNFLIAQTNRIYYRRSDY